MDDRANDAELTLRKLRATVEDLEHRARAVSSPSLRHDAANVVGAARNALVLLGENPEPEAAVRFMEIAQRNVGLAKQLLCGGKADGASPPASGRDERNDLGRAGEGEHQDTLGF
jgi:hypothetical protein